ncbi:MAG TPA: EF-hand domain-containing protein [Aliiroseovarius sp.]|nr:EF-hand domain-containing protein [Aliiroseovarius sp.]
MTKYQIKRARDLLIGSAIVALAASLAVAGDHPAGKRGPMPRMPLFTHFATIDTDGNGEVTMAELEAFGAARFAAADADGDGLLSRDEVLGMIQAQAEERRALARDNGAPERPAPNAQRLVRIVDRLFDRRDTDDDGMLSAAEIEPPMAMVERLFARLDADGNGAISVDEVETALAERGKCRPCNGADAAPGDMPATPPDATPDATPDGTNEGAVVEPDGDTSTDN